MLKTFLERSSLTLCQKRLAGHSKWANIRHTKALKDGQRSLMYTRFGRQMKVAVQEGGSSDPSKNPKLEQVIQQARRYNMPVATIQAVIKSTQTNAELCKKYVLEIKGPGGSILLCEVFTDNLIQTKSAISSILKKHLSKYAESGVKHMFEEKGVIEGRHDDFKGKSEADVLEMATEHAIEFGAEDVKALDDRTVEFSCTPNALGKVQEGLGSANYAITSASVEFVPVQLQILNDRDLETCSNLCEKLENLPDVVKVYDNVA